MPLDSRQQSDFQNWVGRGVDFQNRGAQGVDTYDKPLNPSIFGSRPLAPPILANVGTPWNSLWGMRGSARGCLCMPLDSGQQSDFQNWVGRGVDFQNRGAQGVDMNDKPLDPPILGNRSLALPFLPMWVPCGIASGECVGVLGNAYVCLLTQDNKAISRIGWVEGSISRIGGRKGLTCTINPLTSLFWEIDPLPLLFLPM